MNKDKLTFKFLGDYPGNCITKVFPGMYLATEIYYDASGILEESIRDLYKQEVSYTPLIIPENKIIKLTGIYIFNKITGTIFPEDMKKLELYISILEKQDA